jgi:hypothetical protein
VPYIYSIKIKVMEKEVVPYEESVALSQIGFVQSCWYAYHDLTWPSKEDKHKLETIHNLTSYTESYAHQYVNPVLAPTYSQAFRWFRYNYWYYVSISPSIDIGNVDFTVEVSQFFQEDRYVGEGDDEEYFPRGLELVHTERFDTYEEAELACLRKLIEIAKTK